MFHPVLHLGTRTKRGMVKIAENRKGKTGHCRHIRSKCIYLVIQLHNLFIEQSVRWYRHRVLASVGSDRVNDLDFSRRALGLNFYSFYLQYIMKAS